MKLPSLHIRLLILIFFFFVLGTYFFVATYVLIPKEEEVLREYIPVKEEFSTRAEYNLVNDVFEVLKGDDNLTEFVSLLKYAEMDEILTGGQNLTILAPNNEVFDLLSPEEMNSLQDDKQALQDLLNNHILVEQLNIEQLVNSNAVLTKKDLVLDVTTDELDLPNIGGIPVLSGDLVGKNGTVHIVGGLLYPTGVNQ